MVILEFPLIKRVFPKKMDLPSMTKRINPKHSIDRWSAGGVVLRPDPHDKTILTVALCHRKAECLWALPKGTPEKDETVPQTAEREVAEETGLIVEIGPPIDNTFYSFFRTAAEATGDLPFDPKTKIRIDKTVHWYLMKYVRGDIANHDCEYDDVEWIKIEEALKRLTHRNEARILEKAVAFYENGATTSH